MEYINREETHERDTIHYAGPTKDQLNVYIREPLSHRKASLLEGYHIAKHRMLYMGLLDNVQCRFVERLEGVSHNRLYTKWLQSRGKWCYRWPGPAFLTVYYCITWNSYVNAYLDDVPDEFVEVPAQTCFHQCHGDGLNSSASSAFNKAAARDSGDRLGMPKNKGTAWWNL